jgi:hypothetical protein
LQNVVYLKKSLSKKKKKKKKKKGGSIGSSPQVPVGLTYRLQPRVPHSSLRGLAKRFSNSYSGLFKEFAISLLQAM